jgi:hypothetical protein
VLSILDLSTNKKLNAQGEAQFEAHLAHEGLSI